VELPEDFGKARKCPEINANKLQHVATCERRRKCKKHLIYMVPGERIELPTNGLQNRCSTAELTRHHWDFSHSYLSLLAIC
jgi:hypothetical protein